MSEYPSQNYGLNQTRELSGEKTAWRIRIGEYRVIYDVFDTELVVTVVRAGHRREVYDR